ncbi:uncharacterized protein UBRO_20758 [Ustilago bromivora]|uniref:Uncharacterized protein n=1 Tax=Ustilago bromivora TaxID=307758 RepID=A0A1K0GSQ7_9BASI|nr:uncharacterized protein UBRO_20758 [Ustilago bromivora]
MQTPATDKRRKRNVALLASAQRSASCKSLLWGGIGGWAGGREESPMDLLRRLARAPGLIGVCVRLLLLVVRCLIMRIVAALVRVRVRKLSSSFSGTVMNTTLLYFVIECRVLKRCCEIRVGLLQSYG